MRSFRFSLVLTAVIALVMSVSAFAVPLTAVGAHNIVYDSPTLSSAQAQRLHGAVLAMADIDHSALIRSSVERPGAVFSIKRTAHEQDSAMKASYRAPRVASVAYAASLRSWC